MRSGELRFARKLTFLARYLAAEFVDHTFQLFIFAIFCIRERSVLRIGQIENDPRLFDNVAALLSEFVDVFHLLVGTGLTPFHACRG